MSMLYRKLQLILCWLLVYNLTTAQVYQPLPTNSNYFWYQHSFCNGYRYVIRYEKDSTIKGLTYNVYAQRDIAPSPSICPGYITRGFIHQDTSLRKAYIYLPHKDTTAMLYDFKVNLHDSVVLYNAFYDKMVHLRVEKMEVFSDATGKKLKAYWTSDENLYVESLGSFFGGIFGHNQIGAMKDSKPEELICFGSFNPYKVITMGDPMFSQSCTINGIDESGRLPLSLFPTLTSSKINFEINHVSGPVEVLVYNTEGRLVISLMMFLDAEKGELQVSGLPAGVYQVVVKSANEVYAGRFVKVEW